MSANAIKIKTKKSVARVPAPAPKDYLRLIRSFPLLPIESADVHKQALVLANDLLKKKVRTGKLARGENGYLSILVQLIEAYEKKNFPRQRVSDADILDHLIEAREVTRAQIERDTGIAAPTLSAVIAGRRRLTRDQIGKLSGYFGVSPTVFSFE